jgi:catechol 2,3-dioxygenase-like lactoylglutathione lyase family enzyme
VTERTERTERTEGYFHVGIVVPDLERAAAYYTDLLGIEWGPVLDLTIDVRLAEGGDRTLPNKIVYSTGHPRIELIEEVPGSPWVCNEHSNLHHIGFFTGSLAADAERLVAASCPLEMTSGRGDGPPDTFTYHRDPWGVRLELVDDALRPTMETFMFRAPGS